MFETEIRMAYEEYGIDCECEGITPQPIWKWVTE